MTQLILKNVMCTFGAIDLNVLKRTEKLKDLCFLAKDIYGFSLCKLDRYIVNYGDLLLENYYCTDDEITLVPIRVYDLLNEVDAKDLLQQGVVSMKDLELVYLMYYTNDMALYCGFLPNRIQGENTPELPLSLPYSEKWKKAYHAFHNSLTYSST